MSSNNEVGLKNELAGLVNARRQLSFITTAMRDPLFFRKHGNSGDERFRAAVAAQRAAWQGVRIELGFIGEDKNRIQNALDEVVAVLVRTQ